MSAATLLPPVGFLPAGPLERAERASAPKFGIRPPMQARHTRGLRYEAAVREALAAWADQIGARVEFGPWFRFCSRPPGAWRWCQPDVVVDAGPQVPLLVLEVKLAFEPRAWWQLERLYRSVVELATGRAVRLAAVCGSFDPAVGARVPAPIDLAVSAPAGWLTRRLDAEWFVPGALPVLQWKKPSAATLEG